MEQAYFDVLLIGGGAAGLSLALRLAPHARIALVTKGPLPEGATLYAQGGISAVWDQNDSIASHIADTLNTGAGLCDEAVVRFTVERGHDAIQWLIDQGVPFTRETRPDGTLDYHLTREGGHSHRRVLHAADATGRAIEMTLEQQARRHPNIELYEHHIAIDLIFGKKLGLADNRCHGAYLFDRTHNHVKALRAKFVVLATGGAGKVYLYSSNPDISTGDGIAMAWRAGCRVANLEFIQFHPTCLYHPQAKSFLITEAIRGEGGRLLLPDGTSFLEKFDPRAELAPRDIVARAIDYEMKRLGTECVYLDISHKPADFIKSHFPAIYARCLEFGFDITKEPIPVVPAAHYTCGGVMTDLHGRTDLEGLYAVGETAHTGLHGANRMASNSLLECLVFGQAAADDIHAKLAATPPRHRCRSGTKVGSPIPTRKWWWRTTGTSCDVSCGTTSASSAPTSVCNAPNTARICCCRKSPNTTAISASPTISSNCATSPWWRNSSSAARPCAKKAAACITPWIIPNSTPANRRATPYSRRRHSRDGVGPPRARRINFKTSRHDADYQLACRFGA